MRSWETHPTKDPDYQAREEEQERRLERRIRDLDNTWECYQERSIEIQETVEPKPAAAAEPLAIHLHFGETA
jgi:hypothetical protein